MKNIKVLIAHPGTQHSHRLVSILYQNGYLFKFYTGIAISKETRFHQFIDMLPFKIRTKLSGRIIEKVPANFIRNFWCNELLAYLLLKIGINPSRVFYTRNKIFQHLISKKAIREADIIIGFDTASWHLSEMCKRSGKKFILDYSSIEPNFKNQICVKINNQFPQWSDMLQPKQNKLLDLERLEQKNADKIVVASSFTKKSMSQNLSSYEKICIIPYGVDTDFFKPSKKIGVIDKKKVDFVFVGKIDAKKGIPLLLEAWKDEFIYKNSTLTLIGEVDNRTKSLIENVSKDIKITGKLSRIDLANSLNNFTVMVFPSYFEGFGLVILEGLASGLPVITTRNTGGLDIIENMKDGIIITEGDIGGLIDAVSFYINNIDNYPLYSNYARKKSEVYSWNLYAEKWSEVISIL
ncbi:MAG: glycosyltransferase family 4 protein [Bacteroidia bacterium]